MAEQLNQQGFTTKRWVSTKGLEHGGKPLNPKYLYRILTHPLYIGKITHKEKVWAGKHEPIIDKPLWDQVHCVIQKQHRQTRHRWDHPYLLKGKLRTHEAFAMSPSTVHRPAPGPRSKTKGEKTPHTLLRQPESNQTRLQELRHQDDQRQPPR